MRLAFDGASFSVDSQRRTMTAVMVPWGKVGAHRNGRRWRFERGSLRFAHPKYILLNDEHVQSARLGRGIEAVDTDAGLQMTFRVNADAAGDRALALALNRVKTGFSIEIEFDEMDSYPDPDDPGVRVVTMANLTGVAFCEHPVFDDSRLISVQANKQGGPGMPKDPNAPATPGTDPPATIDPPTTTDPAAATSTGAAADPTGTAVVMSSDQFSQLMSHLGAGDTRTVVDPTTRDVPAGVPAVTAVTQVSEPLPYRFSRQEGRTIFHADAKHDFSTDLFAAINPKTQGIASAEALNRVNALIAAAFADVESADVTALNPNRHRPDLWQPQMDYNTPLWDMVGAGTTDGTKFDIPKFTSSSGLVNAATEKTEPAGGSMVVELQTITPTQVWGKAEITRQAWRSGGTPQLSGILWDQFLREYYEEREAAVATFLNTLTAAADIAITGTPASSPDNDDDQASANDLEMAIAALQFVRGGNRFRAFAVHIDLYKMLARVKDDAGRPLYPMINPQNANGTAANLFGELNIAGTRAVPSWALGATGTVSANSWLFDPAKVRGWASAPERLFWDFGSTVQTANIPQLSFVTMGIYGDLAFGNTDINGVRQVTFDPSV